MNNKTEHTPTPWCVTSHAGHMAIHAEYEPHGEIAKLSDQDRQQDGGNDRLAMLANARFIVTACNHHDELVAVLNLLRKLHECGRAEMDEDELRVLNGALAKLKED